MRCVGRPLTPPHGAGRHAARRGGALAAVLLACGMALAQDAPPPLPAAHDAPAVALAAARARWHDALADFARADREQPSARGGVLFVGSSSVRLWSGLAQDFPQWPVVSNRGFGGSTLADCGLLAHDLVTPPQPRLVLVYAGDNDLARGQAPDQVLQSFLAFVRAVRSELPRASIGFISIKPSPTRAALLERVRQANRLIATAIEGLPDTFYIDIFSPMLDGQGRPRAELFGADGLHLNADGYRLWQSVIAARESAVRGPDGLPSAGATGARGAAPAVRPGVATAVFERRGNASARRATP